MLQLDQASILALANSTLPSSLPSGSIDLLSTILVKADKKTVLFDQNNKQVTILDRTVGRNGTLTYIQLSPNQFLLLSDYFNTIPVCVSSDTIWIGYSPPQTTTQTLTRNQAILASRSNADLYYSLSVISKELLPPTNSTLNNLTHSSLPQLEDLLVQSLEDLVGQQSTVFISFSGGIDSLLCASLMAKHFPKKDIYLISTAFSKSTEFTTKDRTSAQRGYEAIRAVYPTSLVLLLNDISRADVLANTAAIQAIAQDRTMDFNLAALHFFTAQKAAAYNGSVLFTGTGGDELFLGYAKHRNTATPADTVRQEIVHLDQTNLHRDYFAASFHHIHLVSPFLTNSIFQYALAIASPATIGKLPLLNLLGILLPGYTPPRKLAGQFGSGLADTVRSLKCRAPTLCPNNECLSLECTPPTHPTPSNSTPSNSNTI
ncbi:hypothetical protein NEHOM01_2069 [Nematocida homosporus]|uniref:uncharacterized protein n=1 Tax=Nematocida homosporus TaxID=1912981 RepID=UPI00221F406D|nr:uncharacterized protein NEHOM01_2069 [Nematocida homosporus]KAI5187291.1 hypothetical protein NEHOM01_2069 [Nematocida homosporus]